MTALPYKTKQLLAFTAKLFIVTGAFYFICIRLKEDNPFSSGRILSALKNDNAGLYIGLILILSFFNRFLEILKWRLLASTLRPVSLKEATRQVLAAVTVAIFTPNGLGEYPAKAMYFKKKDIGQVIFLNLICNGIQMIIAGIAGLAGLIIFNSLYNIISPLLLIGIVTAIILIIVLLFISRKVTVCGFSVGKIFNKINALPKAVLKNTTFYAVIRYLCIIHQHYFLFLLFGVFIPYPVMISAIAGIYLLGSALPNFTFIDFAVRGSVAVYIFGVVGVNEWVIVLAATLQWFLNIVLPVIPGAYFVATYKVPTRVKALHQE